MQNPILNSNSTVLITPYSGSIGSQAKSLWNAGKYFEWATIIGKNHWKAPENVNSIFDRSILTFLTDLIDEGLPEEKILEAIMSWKPLPDILFFCDIPPLISLERRTQDKDQFDELKSLEKYYVLYKKAINFVETHNLVKIINLDTNMPIEDCIKQVEKSIKK